ncbi:hypothetical protein Q9R32_03365 [Actinotalea sp. AC32]|nr:hypothetical protein [Actinotalea sp. AC32]
MDEIRDQGRPRPADDPDQTEFHFGWRFVWFGLLPLMVVGGAFLMWSTVGDLRSGTEVGPRGLAFLGIYPVGVIAWVVGLVRYRRARRAGRTPVPGSWSPRSR